MPSHLAAIWHKAGSIWVDRHIRKMQRLKQQHGGLQSTRSEDLSEPLPVAPAVEAPIDWPWRPRDLEALLARFDLLVDGEDDRQLFGRERFARRIREQEGPSVLTYDGFIAFWDESGIEELLGEVRTDEMLVRPAYAFYPQGVASVWAARQCWHVASRSTCCMNCSLLTQTPAGNLNHEKPRALLTSCCCRSMMISSQACVKSSS